MPETTSNEKEYVSIFRALIVSEYRHYCESKFGKAWAEPDEEDAAEFAEYLMTEYSGGAATSRFANDGVQLLELAAREAFEDEGGVLSPTTAWKQSLTEFVSARTRRVTVLKEPMEVTVWWNPGEEVWMVGSEELLMETRGHSVDDALTLFISDLGGAFQDFRAWGSAAIKEAAKKYDPEAGTTLRDDAPGLETRPTDYENSTNGSVGAAMYKG